MHIAGAILPLVTLVLIAFLIVRSRFTARPLVLSVPRWSFPRPKPPKRTKATLIPFDRAKMDDELDRFLREKR